MRRGSGHVGDGDGDDDDDDDDDGIPNTSSAPDNDLDRLFVLERESSLIIVTCLMEISPVANR